VGRFEQVQVQASSLVPRPPCPAFVACSMKSGGKAWTDLSHDACCCWRPVQSAHIWVCSLPFTLLSLNSIRSFCSVCPASSIATGSIVASYSTWRQQRHASRDKSVQAFPHFRTASNKSWVWKPGNEATGMNLVTLITTYVGTCNLNMLRTNLLQVTLICALGSSEFKFV